MEFIYEPELQRYMEQKGKKDIVVEVVACDNSDFEITELHVYFVNERQKRRFVEEKKYRRVPTSMGEVLLPNYRLEYNSTITFGLKSFLGIKTIRYEGIAL